MAYGVYIDGKWSDGAAGWFEKTDPATGETSWDGEAASEGQVASAAHAARSALHDWSARPQHDRTRILEAYAIALAERGDRIAEAIGRDMGKTRWEAESEVGAMKAKIAISIEAQVERAG